MRGPLSWVVVGSIENPLHQPIPMQWAHHSAPSKKMWGRTSFVLSKKGVVLSQSDFTSVRNPEILDLTNSELDVAASKLQVKLWCCSQRMTMKYDKTLRVVANNAYAGARQSTAHKPWICTIKSSSCLLSTPVYAVYLCRPCGHLQCVVCRLLQTSPLKPLSKLVLISDAIAIARSTREGRGALEGTLTTFRENG